MAAMQLYWPRRTQTVLLAQLRDNSPSSSLVGQRSCRSRVIWWRLIVSFYMLSTEVLGLCDDELFLDWGNGIVNGVWLFHLSMNLPVCIDFVMPISLDLASSLIHLFFCFHWLLLIFYSFRRTGPLPMMSLPYTICWLFYYWAHPIADDVFVPIHLSPFIANTQVQHHVALPPGFMGKRGYILPLLVGTVCRLAYVVSVLLHLI